MQAVKSAVGYTAILIKVRFIQALPCQCDSWTSSANTQQLSVIRNDVAGDSIVHVIERDGNHLVT